jgi:diamine N-acetyltransferase
MKQLQHIRPGTIQDAQALADLGASTFYDTYYAYNTAEDMADYLSNNFNINNLEHEIADPLVCFFVAESEKLVGYIKLVLTGNTYIPEQKAIEISRFYVARTFQGSGVGKKLMQAAENYAAEQGCSAIWLSVWQKNPNAIRIYERLGFVIVGTTTFTLGSDVQDDYIMVKQLLN